jgi:hypothetical protein
MKTRIIVHQDFQRFDLVGVKPYIRKQDSKKTDLLTFQSNRIACGRQFANTMTMTMAMLDNSRPFNRRCDKCSKRTLSYSVKECQTQGRSPAGGAYAEML